MLNMEEGGREVAGSKQIALNTASMVHLCVPFTPCANPVLSYGWTFIPPRPTCPNPGILDAKIRGAPENFSIRGNYLVLIPFSFEFVFAHEKKYMYQ